jgi:hypothetical protein
LITGKREEERRRDPHGGGEKAFFSRADEKNQKNLPTPAPARFARAAFTTAGNFCYNTEQQISRIAEKKRFQILFTTILLDGDQHVPPRYI